MEIWTPALSLPWTQTLSTRSPLGGNLVPCPAYSAHSNRVEQASLCYSGTCWTLCYTTLCYTTLCYAALRYTALYYTTLCYTILCYMSLRFPVLR